MFCASTPGAVRTLIQHACFDGANAMSPTTFREILADVINSKRNVPKSVTGSEAADLLQRWIEASKVWVVEENHA